MSRVMCVSNVLVARALIGLLIGFGMVGGGVIYEETQIKCLEARDCFGVCYCGCCSEFGMFTARDAEIGCA